MGSRRKAKHIVKQWGFKENGKGLEKDVMLLAELTRALKKHSVRRARKLLQHAEHPQKALNRALPPNDQTILHTAALNGNGRFVKLLVAYGANVNAVDANGQTPFHVVRDAVAVRALLRAAQKRGDRVDLDLRDSQGCNVQQAILRVLEAKVVPGRQKRSSRPSRSSRSTRAHSDDEGSSSDSSSSSMLRRGTAASRDAFAAKLAEESAMEFGEGDAFSWAGDMEGAESGDWFGQIASEAAERRARDRAAADARRDAAMAAERAARNAARNAARASAEHWQRAASEQEAQMAWLNARAAETAASTLSRDVYEKAWEQFKHSDGALGMKDVPWPCPVGELSAAKVAPVVLPPNLDAGARRKLLQEELRRWHPDKFSARFAARLLEGDKEEVMGHVTRVSQCLNELMQELKASDKADS